MASNFPSSLDSFTNPSSSDAMDSVSVPHATQHSDLNDAVEALQAKVGADSSAVTTSHDYKIADHASRLTTLEALGTAVAFTPSWNANLTVGNATQEWYYVRVNKLLYVSGYIQLGSTSSITGFIQFSNPTGVAFATPNGIPIGVTELDGKLGNFIAEGSGNGNFRLNVGQISGSYLQSVVTSSTVPTTWTTGDRIRAAGTVALS